MINSNLTYTVTSGSLPSGLTLNQNTGEISGVPAVSYTFGGTTTSFTVTANNGLTSTARAFSITRKWRDGSTSALAGTSADAIKQETGTTTDGVYYINLPTVGPTQLYCRMSNLYGGFGWIMAMKATRGNTFTYGSTYWSTNNTLNPSQYNTSDGDAKFDAFNYYPTNTIMALWPDIPATTNSGTGGAFGTGTGVWSWVEDLSLTNRHFADDNQPSKVNLLNLFSRNEQKDYIPNSGARNWPGKAGNTGPFTSQGGWQWYGFNYQANAGRSVRWGFSWNNEGDQSSNDSGGGLGLGTSNRSYSAGDVNDAAADYGGINRSARVELYVK